VTQKVVKDSALVDYLAHQPVEDYQSMQCEFLNEGIMVLFDNEDSSKERGWIMWFDGASNITGHGIGVILPSPEKKYIPITARLCFNGTNNIAKYEACTLGLQVAVESKIKKLEVYGDSALVIH